MSDFNIKLTVRSARILAAIEDTFGTQAEMARQSGLSYSRINAYVALRESPVGKKGWTNGAVSFASALGMYPSDLWPEHLKDVTLKRSTASFTVDLDAVKALTADGRNMNLAHLLGKAAVGVPERNLLAVRMHLEGATLDDMGAELGVSRERARQIMMKGLREMRTKLRRLGVKEFTDAIE